MRDLGKGVRGVHEWALASAVVKTLKKEMERREGVKGAEVLIGELQTIEEEVFGFALKEIAREQGLKIVPSLKLEPAEFKCRSCGNTWDMEHVRSMLSEEDLENVHFIPEVIHVFVKCPKCGSDDYDVVKGRGISLRLIT